MATGPKRNLVALAHNAPSLGRRLDALADEGNEAALDRLADLADQRSDLDELGDLLDEGSMRAGKLLTRRAVATGNLLLLQRIGDAGYEQAARELERLLAPSDDISADE